jgi:NAD(P) transhydrogenase subunit alpha
MKLIVLHPPCAREKRVALIPDHVPALIKMGFTVGVEAPQDPCPGSNLDSLSNVFPPELYEKQGAFIARGPALFQGADVALCVEEPDEKVLKLCPPGLRLVGLLGGRKASFLQTYQRHGLSAFSLDLLPRTSRAQFMDVLSSQSSLLGYRAVILGACLLDSVVPTLTSAAGTLHGARVLVLGAGVAGLQAIGTAKRLGARVSACDIRQAAKEEVESLGAQFVTLPAIQGEGQGGYGRALNADEQRTQHDVLTKILPLHDLVICSALIPGREPPLLLTHDMAAHLKPGSVVIDLATQGREGLPGNCAFSLGGETIWMGQTRVVGCLYELSHISRSASTLYSQNLVSFLKVLWDQEKQVFCSPDQDELLQATCVTASGPSEVPEVKNTPLAGDL